MKQEFIHSLLTHEMLGVLSKVLVIMFLHVQSLISRLSKFLQGLKH